MNRRRMAWHLAFRMLAVCVAALVVLGWLAARAFDRSLTRSTWMELEATANLAASETAVPLAAGDETAAAAAARKIAQSTRMRITLVAPDGRVVFDSSFDAERLDNHGNRPEILAALAGQTGHSPRYSASRDERMLYAGVPIRRDGAIVGAARAAVSSAVIERAYRESQQALLRQIVLVALGAAVVCLWLARRTSRPVEDLSRNAEALARGETAPRGTASEVAELASLAASLQLIGRQLEERRQRIGRQGYEQEAVLGSMMEGVLAVDSDERLLTINSAAANLIGTKTDVRGRNLQEVIRNADLRRFVKRALESLIPIEDDISLHGEVERILRVRGTALHDNGRRGVGAVIVLNDVTNIRRLENMRRDFVANVSHELKTPIASIKGFVETLLDGALQNPDDAERFLRIVGKQAERLNNIIEDLLSLSKIELSEEAENLPLEQAPLRGVLEAAIHSCQVAAADRQITLSLDCDPQAMAAINGPLLEQAATNLIDNAIKYSEPGSVVQVAVRSVENELVIDVRDEGCGIASEHLPRLFERFYRVDRARSRKLGGTGLGLAIVKHIVQAHGGHVQVASVPGEGSTFSIHLPRRRETSATKPQPAELP